MSFETLRSITQLPEVEDPEEEAFLLFSQNIPSQNLGFIDSAAAVLELTIAGRDLTIHQSPTVLSSNRAGGTTGAVVWKITPLFAEWLASPGNILFRAGILTSSSAVLELGCGVSAIVGLILAPHVSRYVLTDQPYVAKFVAQNIDENKNLVHAAGPTAGSRHGKASSAKSRKGAHHPHENKKHGQAHHAPDHHPTRPGDSIPLRFTPLDWETDEVTASLTGSAEIRDFDAVVACDCIYNEALIDPFVRTCVDVCRLRSKSASPDGATDPDEFRPCFCIVAQQLRDPDIFVAWAKRYSQSFYVVRIPDEQLPDGLRSSAGFVVHIGVLKY